MDAVRPKQYPMRISPGQHGLDSHSRSAKRISETRNIYLQLLNDLKLLTILQCSSSNCEDRTETGAAKTFPETVLLAETTHLKVEIDNLRCPYEMISLGLTMIASSERLGSFSPAEAPRHFQRSTQIIAHHCMSVERKAPLKQWLKEQHLRQWTGSHATAVSNIETATIQFRRTVIEGI